MTLVIVVGTGIRDEIGCTKDCFCTVMAPADVAAMACICPSTQAVAAPMPRTGSVWLDKVCLVPNCTSRCTVASILLGLICLSSARSSAAGSCLASAGAVPAWAVPPSKGTVAAVTAEADRKARGLVLPRRPANLLASMPRVDEVRNQMSTPVHHVRRSLAPGHHEQARLP